MNPGPLRRLLGSVGLLVLAPVAYQLASGALTPVEGAQRAVVILLVVVLLGRLLGAYLSAVATRFDVGPPGPTPDQARRQLAEIRARMDKERPPEDRTESDDA